MSSPRPHFVTDDMVVIGQLLAQAGFSFEADCSPDPFNGRLLLSGRAWAWMVQRFPGIEKVGPKGR